MKFATVFVDLCLLLLFCILRMWILAMALINVTRENDPAPDVKVDFMITVTWDATSNADVDSWSSRQGNEYSKTGFNNRENDVFILHNDNTSAAYGMVDGVRLKEAVEVTTINNAVPDTYYFSLHGYRVLGRAGVPAHVIIAKVSPYRILYQGEVQVYDGSETKVFSWTINEDKDVVASQGDPDKIPYMLR